MLKERLKSYGVHKLAIASIVYFSISALLSLTIFLRLLVLPIEPIKYSNAIFYYLNYYVLYLFVGIALIIIYIAQLPKIKAQKRYVRQTLMILVGACLLFIEVGLIVIGIPDYFSLILPVPIAASLYISQCRTKKSFSKRQITLFLTLVLSVSFLMPPATAYLCYQNVLSQASSKTDSEKASFVASFVASSNTNVNMPFMPMFVTLSLRAGSDFQKYLMTGVGACFEMASSTNTFLNTMGGDAREIALPGEDHAFVEVNLNETWYVLDPGYFGPQIWTRQDRASYRIINETTVGAVSYVIALQSSSFIELTQYYVPTDTIIIRVVSGDEPVTSALLYLEHMFHGKTQRLPDNSHSFYSDTNGTITIHLGNTTYPTIAGNTDSFYRLYVNGVKTPYAVTSTGSNKTQFIEIDLAKLR